jgi:hypothetical protein
VQKPQYLQRCLATNGLYGLGWFVCEGCTFQVKNYVFPYRQGASYVALGPAETILQDVIREQPLLLEMSEWEASTVELPSAYINETSFCMQLACG